MKKFLAIVLTLALALALFLPVNAMEITVESVNSSIETITITIEPTDPIEDIKEKIAVQTGIPADQQRLFLGDKLLVDGNTAQDYGLDANATLTLLANDDRVLTVEFISQPTYTITIPEKVVLDKKTDTGTGTVIYEQDEIITAAAGVRLLNGQTIKLTLSAGEDGFVLTSKENAELPYTVTVNNAEIQNNGVVATFETSQTAQTSTLHFAANDPTYAGQYSDTVTFTISIVSE